MTLACGVFGSKGLFPVRAAICAGVTSTLPFFTVTSGPSKILRLPSWRNLPCGVANSVPWTDRGVLAQELCCCPEQKHFNVDIFVGDWRQYLPMKLVLSGWLQSIQGQLAGEPPHPGLPFGCPWHSTPWHSTLVAFLPQLVT